MGTLAKFRHIKKKCLCGPGSNYIGVLNRQRVVSHTGQEDTINRIQDFEDFAQNIFSIA